MTQRREIVDLNGVVIGTAEVYGDQVGPIAGVEDPRDLDGNPLDPETFYMVRIQTGEMPVIDPDRPPVLG